MHTSAQTIAWNQGANRSGPSSTSSDISERPSSQNFSLTAPNVYNPSGASPPPIPSKAGIPRSLLPGGKQRGLSAGSKAAELFFERADHRTIDPQLQPTAISPHPLIHSNTYPLNYIRSHTPPPPLPVSQKPAQRARPPSLPDIHARSPYPQSHTLPPPLPDSQNVIQRSHMPSLSVSSIDRSSFPQYPPTLLPKPVQIARPQSLPRMSADPSSGPPPLPPEVAYYAADLSGVSSLVRSPEPLNGTPEAREEEGDDDDLARALVLSAQSVEEQARQTAQEEAELARALAESALMSSPDIQAMDLEVNGNMQEHPELELQSSLHDLSRAPSQHKSEVEEDLASSAIVTPPDLEQQMRDDEALARQLEAEEEARATREDKEARQREQPTRSPSPELPQYVAAAASTSALTEETRPTVRSISAGPPIARTNIPLMYPMAIRSASVGPMISSSKLETQEGHAPSRLSSMISPSSFSLVPSTSVLPMVEEDNIYYESESEPSAILAPSQYVEPEFLMGVSMGFAAPQISMNPVPLQDSISNVIPLPFGKCPPFHIQASSWRHLLKLLVRLRSSRIEPTIEATALSRGDLKLRTVVQFVKVHHTAKDWRVVLYLTVDHPVPLAMLGGWRYTNGDVNTLPFSYSLSSLPALLRDGSDSSMAKSYTIPTTASTPYPSLPINLPNLALYLQSALDESRRALHDSSSGMRKLAQLVDSCYPEEVTMYEESDLPERKGVGAALRRVLKFGGKKESRERGGNEDTYELVTPFVPDEWGG